MPLAALNVRQCLLLKRYGKIAGKKLEDVLEEVIDQWAADHGYDLIERFERHQLAQRRVRSILDGQQ